MHIGDLARSTRTTTRALRYYEAQGLLAPERDANGYRRYRAHHVAVVHRIRALLAAGLESVGTRRFLDCARADGGEVSLELCPELRAELDRLRRELVEQERCIATRKELLDRHLAGGRVRVGSSSRTA